METRVTTKPAVVTRPLIISTIERDVTAAVRALERHVPDRRRRHAIPRVLLVGAENSGKTTLLASARMGGPLEPRRGSEKPVCRWWLLGDTSVVLDVRGDVFMPAAGPADTLPDPAAREYAEGWIHLLRRLRRESPARPINAIILALGAEDLAGPTKLDRSALVARARAMRQALNSLAREANVRVPLYVVITKADGIPAFDAFHQALPEHLRQDMLGWSSPHDPDARYDASWPEEAMKSIGAAVAEIQCELLTTQEEIANPVDLTIFPSELDAIREPLGAYLDALLADIGSVADPSPVMLRGVYLTARAPGVELPPFDPDETQSLDGLMPIGSKTLPSAARTETRTPDVDFIQALLRDKLSREQRLARLVNHPRFGVGRTATIARIAAGVAAVAAVAMLTLTLTGLPSPSPRRAPTPGLLHRAAFTRRALADAAIDLDAIRRSRMTGSTVTAPSDANIYALLSDMAELSRQDLRTPVLPTSYFSSIDARVHGSLQAGYRSVILPSLRDRLLERYAALGVGVAGSGTPARPTDPTPIARFVRELRRLGDATAIFNRVAQSPTVDPKELADVVQTTFGAAEYEPVIGTVAVPPASTSLTVPLLAEQRDAALQFGTQVLRRVADSLAAAMSPDSAAEAERGVAVDPAVLHDLRDFLAMGDSTGVIATELPDAPSLGTGLSSALRDSLLSVSASFAQDTAIIAFGEPDRTALVSALDTLLGRGFMTPIENNAAYGIPAPSGPATKVDWNPAVLDASLLAYDDYERFITTWLDSFPASLRTPVWRGAAKHTVSRLEAMVAQSVQLSPGTMASDPAGLLKQAQTEAAGLEGASPALDRLSQIFEALDAPDASAAITRLRTAEAVRILQVAQRLLESRPHYQPVAGALANWRGGVPAYSAAFGASDAKALDAFLTNERQAMHDLASIARAAVRVAKRPEADIPTDVAALVTNWDGIVGAVEKFEGGITSSSLASLERFIHDDMAATDPRNCKLESGTREVSVGDFFQAQRARLRRALAVRCAELTRTAAVGTSGQ